MSCAAPRLLCELRVTPAPAARYTLQMMFVLLCLGLPKYNDPPPPHLFDLCVLTPLLSQRRSVLKEPAANSSPSGVQATDVMG